MKLNYTYLLFLFAVNIWKHHFPKQGKLDGNPHFPLVKPFQPEDPLDHAPK